MYLARLLAAFALCVPLATLRAAPGHGAAGRPAGPRDAASCGAPARYPFPAKTTDIPAGARFEGIAAIAPDDIWAVGTDQTPERALIAHWDGRRWAEVPSARVPEDVPGDAYPTELAAVAAAGRRDVWAAGHQGNRPIVEHWDGARWRLVAGAPELDAGTTGADEGTTGADEGTGRAVFGRLAGVAAPAAGAVWAVGARAHLGQGPGPVIERWDGRRWAADAGATGTSRDAIGDDLRGVAATSPTDVWAAGADAHDPGPLIEHWDGRHWRLFPVSGAKPKAIVESVVALSPADAWIVGDQGEGPDTTTSTLRPLLGHWDGAAWRVVPAPDTWGLTLSLAATSSSDIWAEALGTGNLDPFLVHWDGRRWGEAAPVRSPFEGGALAAPAPGGVWTAGARQVIAGGKTIYMPEIDHYRCTPA